MVEAQTEIEQEIKSKANSRQEQKTLLTPRMVNAVGPAGTTVQAETLKLFKKQLGGIVVRKRILKENEP